MKMMTTWLAMTIAVGLSGAAPDTADEQAPAPEAGAPKKVYKTDAEWAKILTRDQFLVCRMKATEPAFSGKYAHGKAKGIFHCVCCDAPLFSSGTKFESGTGWPSFWSPLSPGVLQTAPDYHMPGEARVEVMCSTCGAHLGHVFADGPPPTGLRYCLNSVALKLEPASKATTASAVKKKGTTAKAKSSRKSSSRP